eukprot:6397292-Pyramimonas_sp.AAC.1
MLLVRARLASADVALCSVCCSCPPPLSQFYFFALRSGAALHNSVMLLSSTLKKRCWCTALDMGSVQLSALPVMKKV